MGPLGFAESLMILVLLALLLVPLWRIAKKMGYPGILGLLAVVPGVNIILAWVLAFSDWPIHQELRRVRLPR